MTILRCFMVAQFVSVVSLSPALAFDWSADDARVLGDGRFLLSAGQVLENVSDTNPSVAEPQTIEPDGSMVPYARVFFALGGAPVPLPPPAQGRKRTRTYLVFFDWDRGDLTARARQVVAQAAQASAHARTTHIEIDGYTDLSGRPAYNQRLSARRAQSVQAELVRDGVDGRTIIISPQNRAVDIEIKY